MNVHEDFKSNKQFSIMEGIFIFCIIIFYFKSDAWFLSSDFVHNIKPLDALNFEGDKKGTI